jgi:FtsH-binding integral membrane protein
LVKIFNFITELIGWFQIILFPLLIGLVLGAIIYGNKRDTIGLIVGITVATIGLIIGIVLATKIWKKNCIVLALKISSI